MFMIGFTVGALTGAGIVLFGAVLAYRIAQIHATEPDEGSEPVQAERAPRCGQMTPGSFGGTLGPCVLAYGHGGMHEEDHRWDCVVGLVPGARWTPETTEYAT